MSGALLTSRWALIRRNELVDIPDKIEIHSDFLQSISHEAFESAFREIGGLFYRMYSDMADAPQRFGLPLCRADEYDCFSSQAREARSAPWQPFYVLFCLFACGYFRDNIFAADTAEVRKINKAKRMNLLLEALCLADVKNYYSNQTAFSNAFIGWNYKILAEDMHTCNLAEGCDYVADKMHNAADREVLAALDKILMDGGADRKKGDPNEGPSVRYFCRKLSEGRWIVMRFQYCPYCGKKAVKKEIGDEGVIPYCAQCELPLWDMFTTSVIAAVVNECGEIALLRQSYVSTTKYVCVAGIMKPGESAEETMIREIGEELGLNVKSIEYVKSYPYEKKEMLMLGFKAVVEKRDFVLSGEVDAAEWVKPGDAPRLLREGSIAWQLVKAVIGE